MSSLSCLFHPDCGKVHCVGVCGFNFEPQNIDHSVFNTLSCAILFCLGMLTTRNIESSIDATMVVWRQGDLSNRSLPRSRDSCEPDSHML